MMRSETMENNLLLNRCLSIDKNTCAFKIIPITIDENNVYEGAQEILKLIRSSWNPNNIRYKLFTDGKTNKLVGCFLSNRLSNNNNEDHLNIVDEQQDEKLCGQDVILIRVYGNKTDLLIDRTVERNNILLFHAFGFAPSLYGTFNNGLVYEYVPGVTLTLDSVIDTKIWPLIARNMAEMHRIIKYDNNNTVHTQQLCGNSGCMAKSDSIVRPLLWDKVQQFLNLIPEQFSNPIAHERISKTFQNVEQLRDEFFQLYQQLEKLNSPIVFCHNDLLLGNVIYNEGENKVTFIDYEYAGYNYQAFDIGNHFTEFVGMDDIDYKLYPSKDFQMQWLRVYLETFNNTNSSNNNNNNNNIDDNDNKSPITDDDIERLYIQVNQFALASHFFWAIWSLIQSEYSTIDFDFVNFAEIRYNEYLAKKDEFLSLTYF